MRRGIRAILAALALLGTILFATLLYCQEDSYAESGTLATSRGIVEEGIVFISNGSIQGVGSKIPLPPGTPLIKTIRPMELSSPSSLICTIT